MVTGGEGEEEGIVSVGWHYYQIKSKNRRERARVKGGHGKKEKQTIDDDHWLRRTSERASDRDPQRLGAQEEKSSIFARLIEGI